MSRTYKFRLLLFTFGAWALLCVAKNPTLNGKMVAYDLMRHAAKDAGGQQNEEVIVLQLSGPKPKLVKVVYSSSDTTQIDPKYFDGSAAFDVQVFRDKSCDESAPRFVSQVQVEKMGGTYLLTDAFKSQSPGRIKSLPCYVAIARKKKK